MYLRRIVAPTGDVVSLNEVKRHLRVDHDDDDAVISGYIAAAVQAVDGDSGSIGRALLSQTWEAGRDEFPWRCDGWRRRLGVIELSLPPLIEVESVRYYDADDALQTLSTAVYQVVGVGSHLPGGVALLPGQVWPVTSRRREAVAIRYRCGYVDSEALAGERGTVPAPIVLAIKLMVGTLYEHRETVFAGDLSAIPGVSSLLDQYRVQWL